MIRRAARLSIASLMDGTPLIKPTAISDTVGQCPRDPKHAFIVGARPSFAVCGNQDRSLRDGVWRAQWLVPSEKVILFHTLYLPDGRDIGIRLISVNVAAS